MVAAGHAAPGSDGPHAHTMTPFRKVLTVVLAIAGAAVALYAGTRRLDTLRLVEAVPSPVPPTASATSRWAFAGRERPLRPREQQPLFAPRAGREAEPVSTTRPEAWGAWQMVDGALELGDASGAVAAWFLPQPHAASFMLTAEVQLPPITEAQPVVIYLGTRRAPPDTLTSTRVAVYATGGADAPGAAACSSGTSGRQQAVALSHFIAHRKMVASGCAPAVGDGGWHRLSLDLSAARALVRIDDEPVPFQLHDFAADSRPIAAVPLLTGRYDQPYVAVTGGRARFRYLEVAGTTATGGSGNAAASPAAQAATVATRAANVLSPEETARMLAGGATARAPVDGNRWWLRAMIGALYAVLALICFYMARHYLFTLNRLFGRQRHPYLDVDTAAWPSVTVIIPAHNEETVIRDILEALLEVDYPQDRLRILPVNDRSSDRTGAIIDAIVTEHPGRRITPLHRESGDPGKAAVLRDATTLVEDDIVLVFDADYLPGRGLIKQLVAPFFDPDVGAVMGRVIPHNVGRNLLTRMLDLERAGGYQVDQQARMNMRLVPQYGGTVGGVRKQALLAAGGWRTDSLAEDTDATMRLLLAGWKTAYQNRSECYEQVPETWPARIRQLRRWVRGHNQALARYAWPLITSRRATLVEKIDGLMMLGIYTMPPILLLGWALAAALWFLGVNRPGVFVVLLIVSYSSIGNSAIFSEIAAAAYLDGSGSRIRLLPFMLPCLMVNAVVVTWTLVTHLVSRRNGAPVVWHKTARHVRSF